MTVEELSDKYNMSVSSIKNSFPRTQASILKKHGVKIVK